MILDPTTPSANLAMDYIKSAIFHRNYLSQPIRYHTQATNRRTTPPYALDPSSQPNESTDATCDEQKNRLTS